MNEKLQKLLNGLRRRRDYFRLQETEFAAEMLEEYNNLIQQVEEILCRNSSQTNT